MSQVSAGILVFDLGLTNCKAIVFSLSGQILAHSSATYKTYFPSSGEVEQDPDEWWQAVCSASHELWEIKPELASKIVGISVTGHMHALVCVGQKERTVKRSLVLGDQRSINSALKITRSLSQPIIYQITGARMDASMPAAKIRWLKENQPDAHKKTKLFIGCKDYIRHLLTGDRLTDPIDACAMSLYDIQKGCWSQELLAEAGIKIEQLPEITSPTNIAGKLQPFAGTALGVQYGIPVVVSGGDDIEVLGNGLMTPSRSLEHLGTTGSILTVSSKPTYDPEMGLELYPHAKPGLWVIGGSITSAGSTLAWASNILGFSSLEQAFSILSPTKKNITEDQLIFLPHLLGERSPCWQPQSRGSWVGLTTTHTNTDLMWSAFEGTVFALKQILDRIESLAGIQNLITVSGREDANESWLKLRANIYQRPLALLESMEPTALGAMILAVVGIGIFTSLDEAVQNITSVERILVPEKELASVYRRLYGLYGHAQNAMQPYWRATSRSTADIDEGDQIFKC